MDIASSTKVLICDDDETLCYLLKEQLLEEGFSVDAIYDGADAIEILKKKSYDILLLDLNMNEVSGEDVLKFISDNNFTVETIVLTAQTEVRKAIECIKLGAYDFITKPYNFDELLVTIKRAAEHKVLVVQNTLMSNQINKKLPHNIIGESEELQRILNLANKSAISDSNILIEGETGTGKELFAEYVHKHSDRSDKPFVVVNCASLPDQLIESELFGHEKGAFTDAKSAKQGLVEMAHGGTLFLDEIGELSLTLQPKLLRFLENGEFRRIGGVTNLTSNVRVIGATNRNLMVEADNKAFRRDLLFRLNVITLTVPTLRERASDIIILANHFLESKSPIRRPKRLSHLAEEALKNYSFPGNVRELEHIIERALIFAEGEFIEVHDLNLPNDEYLSKRNFKFPPKPVTDDNGQSDVLLSMEELERKHIERVLRLNSWDRTVTANQLGISPKTLYTKIKKYEIKQD